MSCHRCHTSHRQDPERRWQRGAAPARSGTERATMCHNGPIVPRGHRALSHPPHALGPVKGPSVTLGGWRGGDGHRGHRGVCGDRSGGAIGG